VSLTAVSMWKQKAIARLSKTFSHQQVTEFIQLADITSVFPGSDSVFRRISRAKENEAVFDYLAEIRFGLTFAGLEFDLRFEPCGEKGSDLLVSRDGQSAHVEVRRIRASLDEPEPPSLDLGDDSIDAMLAPYGDFEKSVKKLEDELSAKFSQIGTGTSIIACWSDRLSVEEDDFEVVIRHLLIDAQTGAKRIPAGLLFCMFGWNWFTARGQGLRCGVLKDLAEPFVSWASDLKGARFSFESFPSSVGALQKQR
jgi:hypothetical protein